MASFLLLPELTARLTEIKTHPGDHARVAALAAWLGGSLLAPDRGYGEFIAVQQKLAHLKEGTKAFEEAAIRAAGLLAESQEKWEAPWRAAGVQELVYDEGIPVGMKIPLERFLTDAESILPQLPTIVVAEIARMQGDADAAKVAACPAVELLDHLDLGQAGIGDRGAAALAGSPHFGQLRTLELWFNRIGDEGAIALAESKPLSRLRHLNLWDNPLGEGGRAALARSTVLANLHQLDIDAPQEFIERVTAARHQAANEGRDEPLPSFRIINGQKYNKQFVPLGN